ncbi:MAG: ribosome small subunit-dependent GTPase A [Dysgonamonadaceae bacterium]|nr:ribosome small subunit-dependent GTPase A [Dysgonamonadaceae bacterium]MDD4727610.1 ribosome small subunit-dependent GTPase A [Dysgonamonadaceae bacterium]
MKGLVIKNTGNAYIVRTDTGLDIECIAKGNFRLQGIRSTSPVVVGDYVKVDFNADNISYITEIFNRKNYIVRRASNLSKQAHILAANIDLALLFITIKSPDTTTVFIDRFLATAEAYSVPVFLVFNKIDLYDKEDLKYVDALINLYQTIGYQCQKTSLTKETGVNELREIIKDKVTLLAGHSGVGKSLFINVVTGDDNRKVGDISVYHQRGMHTTTFSEMIEIDGGGFLIDTPGIKGFGTINMKEEEVSHYFPEIFKFSDKCFYNNCMHINEPRCAVREALDNHYISNSRYHSYLNILGDIEEGKYR